MFQSPPPPYGLSSNKSSDKPPRSSGSSCGRRSTQPPHSSPETERRGAASPRKLAAAAAPAPTVNPLTCSLATTRCSSSNGGLSSITAAEWLLAAAEQPPPAVTSPWPSQSDYPAYGPGWSQPAAMELDSYLSVPCHPAVHALIASKCGGGVREPWWSEDVQQPPHELPTDENAGGPSPFLTGGGAGGCPLRGFSSQLSLSSEDYLLPMSSCDAGPLAGHPSVVAAPPQPPQPLQTAGSTTNFPTKLSPSASSSSTSLERRATTSATTSDKGKHKRQQFLCTKMCPLLLRLGRCPKRDSCGYAHSQDELRPLPDLRKTKLCASVRGGRNCVLLDCPYAHSADELRSDTHWDTYKSALCFFWKKARCLNGDRCRFAHGTHELSSSSSSNH